MEYTHFKKIADVKEYKNFLGEVEQYEEINSWSFVRTKAFAAMRHTQSIDLRDRAKNITREAARNTQTDYLDAKNYPFFIETYGFIEEFAHSIGGTLARAMIVSLDPQREVGEHIDVGSYYARRDRYHLVLKSKGSIMHSGGEEVIFHEGELWKFDNKVPHSAKNSGNDRRIHVIFDVLPGLSLKTLVLQYAEKFIALR